MSVDTDRAVEGIRSGVGRFKCRACGGSTSHTLVDLGLQPLANAYVEPAESHKPDPVYPLHARVCATCLLVQVDEVVPAEDIFSHYAYFSSYSDSWLEHAGRFAESTIEELGLGQTHKVVEVASNDGYLLRHFVRHGIPVLGIDPAANVTAVAEANGVPTDCSFFGAETAGRLRESGHLADLLVANNVLAHVPDPTDLIRGMKTLLHPEGVITIEVPHLLQLIRHCQFDTIYHEHFSYFSFLVVQFLLSDEGLRAFRVERLSTHGGSLRIWACHADSTHELEASVALTIATEEEHALHVLDTYTKFGERASEVRSDLRALLEQARDEGWSVAAYGAAAKGNTLLNFCGIDERLVGYVVDRSPHKQKRFLPGSRLLIHDPSKLKETRPDYVLILPWNLQEEIMAAISFVRDWGGRFIIPIPTPTVLS